MQKSQSKKVAQSPNDICSLIHFEREWQLLLDFSPRQQEAILLTGSLFTNLLLLSVLIS